MTRVAVLNVVGLTPALLGPHTPRLEAFRQAGVMASIAPPCPAVTCTAQSNYLTGRRPAEHGIVGNGWYDRELAEVHFWKQSNQLVQGRKVWDELRAEGGTGFTCAQLFWWFNMYSTADYSITPRPSYPADGRKVFDIYTAPGSIRAEIQRDLGRFPFATFWGPAAGVKSPQGEAEAASRWIAESAKWIEHKQQPTLSLIYLPHLDYNLQRHGPFVSPRGMKLGTRATSPSPLTPALSPSEGERETERGVSDPTRESMAGARVNPAIIPDLRAIDTIVGDLIDFFEKRDVRVLLLSEYGLTNVDTPVHLNRLFREQGWLAIKDELGLEMLDAGASRVFAVADHQVAHIYLNDRSLERPVRALLESQDAIGEVLGAEEKKRAGLDHPRAGDLLAVAKANAWFTYYYWLDDALAPDFARCVDIHRKPGYDPVELFLDPKIPAVKLKILRRLLQKQLGFRMLMDVIPLDATLVKGSHGRRPESPADGPVLIAPAKAGLPSGRLESTEVYQVIKQAVLS